MTTPARRPLAIIATTLAVALCLTVLGSPASALSFPSDWLRRPVPQPAVVALSASAPDPAFAQAITRLAPYVSRTASGTFRLAAPASVTRTIPANVLLRLRQSSELVNQDIRTGTLVSLPTGRVIFAGATARTRNWAETTPISAASTSVAAADAAPASPSGDSATVQWWGVAFHLSAATAEALVGVLSATATVTAIIGVLITAGVITSTAGIPITVIAGILGIIAPVLQGCIGPNGMNLNLTWLVIGWCTKA